MFQQFVGHLCRLTESTIQMQQELFQKWVSLFPIGPQPIMPLANVPSSTSAPTDPLAFQKKGLEIFGELFKKEYETLETQFKAGLRNIEEAIHLVQVKDPAEFYAKSVDLYKKGFDGLLQTSETQIRDFKSAAAKWNEVVTKGAA